MPMRISPEDLRELNGVKSELWNRT